MNTYNPTLDAHYRILQEMLIEAREKKNWYQRDLAQRLGKAQAFVSKIEAGERRLDWVEVLNLIEILELDEVQFLGEYKARVTAANELTHTALLQQIAARKAAQATAHEEIERLMREHKISFADLQKASSKSKKAKTPK